MVGTNLIRKTSYGRTELFLPSESAIVREVKCMGGIQRLDTACVYHMLPSARDAEVTCCWHCCESIPNVKNRIPLPRMYDTVEKTYHVYGVTCSPSCAKAYILEHTNFDRGQHLNMLVKMLREVYGIRQHVKTAPPRVSLVRFGGIFDPTTLPKAECTLIQPPFVSYCMLVEERADPVQVMQVEESDIIDEPHPPGLYCDYLLERDNEQEKEEKKPTRKTPKRRKDEVSALGPLSKFVRQTN